MFSLNGIPINPAAGSDPFASDRTPKVTVEIAGKEYDRIGSYSYDSDILQLGDPASVEIPDPNGTVAANVGDPFKLYMADPAVSGGKKIKKLTGIVTQRIDTVDDRGHVVTIAAADLGWHLVNNDAPIWKRLAGRTFKGLYDLLIDSTWGFAGFRAENDTNARIKLGGNYSRSIAQLGDTDKPPIVQIEPGDKAADMFIQYAKLANRLVNVSSDGYLQLYKPRYDTPTVYTFNNGRKDSKDADNNVQRATLTRSIDSIWSKAICVGSRYIPLVEGVDPNDPNANSFRGTATASPNPLPFNRLVAFGDPDRLNRAQATARAQWKLQRGKFDAWVYEITVFGHSQGGNFYEPDTLCEVYDGVIGFQGTYYISAVRYNRTEEGTTTTLTIHEPGELAA